MFGEAHKLILQKAGEGYNQTQKDTEDHGGDNEPNNDFFIVLTRFT